MFSNKAAMQRELRKDYTKLRSWRKVAATGKYGKIPFGTLCSILKDNIPVPQEYASEVLETPQFALAEVCPIHGIVHVRKTCPSSGPPRKVYQMSISVRSAQSAFYTLLNQYEKGTIDRSYLRVLHDLLGSWLIKTSGKQNEKYS